MQVSKTGIPLPYTAKTTLVIFPAVLKSLRTIGAVLVS